jgi:hypothetical protein
MLYILQWFFAFVHEIAMVKRLYQTINELLLINTINIYMKYCSIVNYDT